MATSFPSAVSAPGGASYNAPQMDFSAFGNLYNDYQQSQLTEQQKQIRQQQIEQNQRQAQLAQAFPNGLPRDPKTGVIDYPAVANVFAKFGDVGDAMTVLQQQPAPLPPILGGPGQPQAPQPQSGPPPASIPARPLPPPAPNSPQGDSGTNTITSLVTDRLPSQNQTTGATIGRIAETMRIDPNANLTKGQIIRAQGLLRQYAPEIAGTSADKGGSLPPSANAGTAAAQPAPRPQPAAANAAPQGPPQQPAQPLVPQEPLPSGYNDPMKAIQDLRMTARRLAGDPRSGAAQQAQAANAWADRIEKSITPIEVGLGKTFLDPRTGQPVYQGNQPTLSPDAINAAAERYLETGQLPPNLGRGIQGSATMSAIQNQAAELANQRGIDMATLPGKWQQFKSQQVAIQRFTSGPQGNTIRSFNVLVDHLGTLTEAADALKNGNIRLFNSWKQTYAANTGQTAPTNFDGVKALVGDEIVKAVVGSSGALADREEVKKDLDRASSPKQLAELVDKYRKLALGQLRGLRKQYETATGLKNFGDMLLPGTLASLGGNEAKGGSTNVTPNGLQWSVEK